MSDLSRRAQRILHAVVSEYLASGDAVGSRTVTRRHDLALSPATVRNVMADLEDLGMLEQRHTSAGRVPTATGLRFFIDSLLKVRGLTAREKEEIRERVTAPTPDGVVQRASRMLSDLTQHAAVVIAPDPDQQRLDRIEFVPLRDGRLIAVLVTTDGRIENRLVVDEVSANSLERIHNYLNALLVGMTLDEVRERVLRELADDKNKYDHAVAAALRLGHAVFVDTPERAAPVLVSGQSNLLDAELAQDRVRDSHAGARGQGDARPPARSHARGGGAPGVPRRRDRAVRAGRELGRRDALRARRAADSARSRSSARCG